jgi:hypothetical protein
MGIAGAPACLRRHLQSPQDLLGSSCSTQQEVAGSCSRARRLLQDKLIYVAGACGCPAAAYLLIATKTSHLRKIDQARDGNGDPIPDSPRGIPPLGDGDGTNLIPAGI